MSSFEYEKDSKSFFFAIKNLDKKMSFENRKNLYYSGKILKSYASKDILRKKLGLPYYYKGRKIYASQRGEAWANRSGDARRSISYNVSGSDTLNYFNTVDYVKYLEDPEKLNRNAMYISIQKNADRIMTILESGFQKVLSLGGGVLK